MIARVQRLIPFRLVFALLLLLALVFALARPAAQTDPLAWVGIGESNTNSIAELLLKDPNLIVGGRRVDGAALIRFYETREFKLAWRGSPNAAADAEIAFAALSQAGAHGLNRAKYHLETLSRSENGAGSAAVYDVLMTDAILKYMRDVRLGRIAPSAAYRDIALPAKNFDPVAALASALENGELRGMLADLPPSHPEYARLKAALAEYRKIAAGGEWAQLPDRRATRAAGEDERFPLLRARLMREDSSLTPEGDIVEALRRYQSRNGLEPDGKLGPKTLAMLNVPAAERVTGIEANLDRWRWLPATLEPRYVTINAADATLQAIDRGGIVLASRVIVGAADKRTPIFRALAKDVTVNPPWNVPPSIARNEILPKLRRNPNYLVSQRMILLNGPPGDPHGTTIDWKNVRAAGFAYRIQQLPGPESALGVLKLEMPNEFNVYLHDTPGKSAFARNERTLSHGCVRVQDIMPLASLSLSGDGGSAVEELLALIGAGETKRLALNDPLPVYVLYWTAIADADGTVQFRKDVYGRDEELTAALHRENEALGLSPAECGLAH